jgi:hypothetical protein
VAEGSASDTDSKKDLPIRALQDWSRRASSADGSASQILVNDRLDVALACGAKGHLPARIPTFGEAIQSDGFLIRLRPPFEALRP